MKKLLPIEKEFFPYLIKLALPIAVQNILQVALGVTDIFMISRYSAEVGVASVSLSNQIFNNLLLIFFGFGSGSAIFFSRYWGSKHYRGLRETLGLAFTVTVGLAVVGGVLFNFNAVAVMGIMTPDTDLITLGANYLTITSYSFPFVAVSVIIASFLRSIEKSSYPMWITTGMIGVNILLNYTFIFGNFGLPEMGVAGAALGTVISRIIDAALHMAVFMSRKNPVRGRAADYFAFFTDAARAQFLKNFFKIALPVVLGDATWALAITAYKKAYAIAGTEAVAAFAAVDSFYQIFFVLFIGLGSASGIIMGKTIGERDFDRTQLLAKIFIRLNFIFAVPLGLGMVALSPVVPSLYGLSGLTGEYIIQATLICGFFLSFRSLEFFLTVGILRSGGDADFYLIIQTVTLWCIGVPAIFIAARVFGAPAPVLYLIVVIEEVVRDLFCYLRYRSGKWLKSF